MTLPWTPHAGQKKAVKFLLEHAAAGLFADPGVGKTSSVYAAFKVLKRRKLAEKMLVIAPLKPCHLVWPAEAQKWTDFAHLKVVVLHGKDKDRLLHEPADVYVINPDGLDWLLDVKRSNSAKGRVSVITDVKAFAALGFDTLVLDELTLWKHTSSGRHKALKTVVGTFARRWGLTGTPAPNGLIDLFGQAYMLDMGRSFGPYVTHFRNAYFLPGYDGFSWVLQKDAEARIYERLKPLVLRLAAEDYVDMPQIVENVMRFDLSPQVRKVYEPLEDDLIARIGDRVIVAANAASAATKVRQVVSGGLYVDDLPEKRGKGKDAFGKIMKDARPWAWLHDDKTDLVEDLVEELNGAPLLVAYDFHHDLARLRKRFGKDLPVIGGGTSTKEALRIEAAWNKGELPILAGHPACLHPDTLVLSKHRGWVRMIDVKMSEQVFDGIEFVSHSGCSFSGMRNTISKFGITCTPEHLFYVDGTWMEAKNVSNSENSFRKALYTYRGDDASISAMLSLPDRENLHKTKCRSQQSTETIALFCVHRGKISSDDGHAPVADMARNDFPSPMFRRFSLWWKRDWCQSRMASIREFLGGYGTNLFRRLYDRTKRQQQGLFQRKLSLGYAYGATGKQAVKSISDLPRRDNALSCIYSENRRKSWSDNALSISEWVGRFGDTGIPKINLPSEQKEKVYDLVDCGPRRRFVVRNAAGDMFIVHNSMGHGLNLQGSGNHVCWYSQTWNLELHDQLIGRIARQGSKNKRVFVHYLLARKTVDETIYWAIKHKARGQDALLAALKEEKRVRGLK